MSKFKKKNIVFFHPDLGIGGAERLIIDAAVALQTLGHKVTIYTSHCDPRHCFDEARDGTITLPFQLPNSSPTHLITEINRNPRRPRPSLLHPILIPLPLRHPLRHPPPIRPPSPHNPNPRTAQPKPRLLHPRPALLQHPLPTLVMARAPSALLLPLPRSIACAGTGEMVEEGLEGSV
jgi:hypothetical protein